MRYYYFLDEISSNSFFIEEGIDKQKLEIFRKINNINNDTYVSLISLDSETPTFKRMKMFLIDDKRVYYNINNCSINTSSISDITVNDNGANMYSNITQTITYENMIRMCSSVVYGGEGLEKIEEGNLPVMAKIYYYYTITLNRILTPYQFMSFYIATYFEYVNESEVKIKAQYSDTRFKSTYSLKGLHNRLWRAFGSFNREMNIFCLIKESGIFEKVSYNLITDTIGGIDITVVKDNEEFFLRIADNTKRSNSHLDEKSGKREYDYKRTINLLAGVFTDKLMSNINGWRLYNAVNVTKLAEKIEEKIINL